MPTIKLSENLSPQVPKQLNVMYTYKNGNPSDNWVVIALGSDANTNIISINNPPGVNLMTQQNVATRKLIAYYPVAPVPREIVISSVQP